MDYSQQILLKSSTDDLTSNAGIFGSPTFWMLIGGVSIFIGLFTYCFITLLARDVLRNKSFGKKLSHIISHLPDDKSPAWPHIIAGVLCFMGSGILSGVVIAKQFAPNGLNMHAMTLTIGGFIFSILISIISFWTLWQTKSIEHKTGYKIAGFVELIIQLTTDLERLRKDFLENHKRRAMDYHRVFLITTNPLFGMLSYPEEPFTANFESALDDITKSVAESAEFNLKHNHKTEFRFEIICGNSSSIQSFHETFYNHAADAKKLACDAATRTEKMLKEFEDRAGKQIFIRMPTVPPTQFMIIGNTLYEFTLETGGQRSEIFDTDVKEDRRSCNKFETTFKVLKSYK